MKHIIWMAALALTVATWSACSNEDEPTTAEQPAQSRTYTVTTTLSPRDGGTTRSTMTDNGDGSISATWEVGDQIWVLYTNIGDTPEEAMATVTAVDPSTKAATIRVTLTDPKEGDSNISFGYPYNFFHAPKDPCNDQTGTLDDINDNFAAISGTGEMTVSGSDVTLPAVTMDPAMCIWKFSFTDGENDITSAVTKLVIDFPNSDPLYRTYTVTPTSLDNIYVAMYGGMINAQPINIYAQTASGVYRKSAASVTLDAGLTYTSTGLALTSAAAANAVAGDIGKLIGADGNIYPNASIATAIGTTGVAMIAYVGTLSDCTHGLAIALEDVSSSTYKWTNAAGAVTTWASGKAVTGGTWRLPSIQDWQYMLSGCGASGSYSDTPSSMSYSELASKLSTAGGTALQTDKYWTSTEYISGTGSVWYLLFYSGNASSNYVNENNSYYVRACLAF